MAECSVTKLDILTLERVRFLDQPRRRRVPGGLESIISCPHYVSGGSSPTMLRTSKSLFACGSLHRQHYHVTLVYEQENRDSVCTARRRRTQPSTSNTESSPVHLALVVFAIQVGVASAAFASFGGRAGSQVMTDREVSRGGIAKNTACAIQVTCSPALYIGGKNTKKCYLPRE